MGTVLGWQTPNRLAAVQISCLSARSFLAFMDFQTLAATLRFAQHPPNIDIAFPARPESHHTSTLATPVINGE